MTQSDLLRTTSPILETARNTARNNAANAAADAAISAAIQAVTAALRAAREADVVAANMAILSASDANMARLRETGAQRDRVWNALSALLAD